MSAVGICGSDLHWWGAAGIGDAVLDHPLVLGHEAAGIIEDGPRRGERVAIDPAVPHGQADLGPLVTHRFPLTAAAEAFRMAAQRRGLKVIIEPGESA